MVQDAVCVLIPNSMLRLLSPIIGLCTGFMSWRLFSIPSIWKILAAAMKLVADISGWRLFSTFSDGWYPLIFSSRMALKSSFRIAFMKACSCSLAMSGIWMVCSCLPNKSRFFPIKSACSGLTPQSLAVSCQCRSEECRVGKECRSRWSPYH